MTWRNVVKDILMVIFSVLFFLLSPAVTLMQNGRWIFGVVLIVIAFLLGATIVLIASYWHKRDIHATMVGNVVSMCVFIVSPFVAWHYNFSLWPLILIILYLASAFIYEHFIAKKDSQDK